MGSIPFYVLLNSAWTYRFMFKLLSSNSYLFIYFYKLQTATVQMMGASLAMMA